MVVGLASAMTSGTMADECTRTGIVFPTGMSKLDKFLMYVGREEVLLSLVGVGINELRRLSKFYFSTINCTEFKAAAGGRVQVNPSSIQRGRHLIALL